MTYATSRPPRSPLPARSDTSTGEDKPGFYKYTSEQAFLQYAPTAVLTPDYTLLAENHQTYSYPQGGWYWFDSFNEAEAFFSLNQSTDADWLGFSNKLMSDPGINTIMAEALTLSPAVFSGLGVGLGKAADGDTRVFISAWTAVTHLTAIAPEIITFMQAKAVEARLPAAFVTALGGWNPPADPARGDTYTAPDSSVWEWEQPRNPDGTFVSDDPETPESESALRWQPVLGGE